MATNQGTDAVSMIEQDHRKVEQIFQQLKSGSGDKQQLATQLIQELTLHAEIEEQMVYPQARQRLEDGQDLVQEAEEEHQEVKQLIQKLSQTSPDDAQFMQLVTELEQNVQHHVQEEESEMLPQIREKFGDDELTLMGQQAMEAKQRFQQELGSMTGGSGGTTGGSGDIDLREDKLQEMTKEELYEIAQQLEIEGRGSMSKDELISALAKG